MIISEIVGGLGNQLFEYAAARRLSLLLNQDLKLNLDFFETYHQPDIFRLDKFNTEFSVATPDEIKKLKRRAGKGLISKVYRKTLKKQLYKNSKYHFDPNWFYNNDRDKLSKMKDIYLSGYFADPYFFYEVEDILRKEFTLKNELNEANKKMQKQITDVNSVSLHIRRGDYVNNPVFADIPLSYYELAISKIKEKVENPVFFIFSDDLKWAKDNMDLQADYEFAGINGGKTDYMELMLMASCKHNIIANSTFSYWGARLNPNEGKMVFAPKVWYKHPQAQARYSSRKIYQNGWQRI